MRHPINTVERKIAAMAARTHGVVTRQELLQAGVTAGEIRQRLGNGLLMREYAGVYRVGHRAFVLEAQYLAAVRACGDGSFLCAGAAAHLYGLVRGRPPVPEVLTENQRRPARVKTRRARRIDPSDATTYRGIPITTVQRTLVDLAAVVPGDELARACHEASIRHRVRPEAVEAVLARRPLSPGAGELRRVLRGDVHLTLSRLEDRFLDLLARANLPLPETNRPAGAHWVDCRWPEHRLTVELDSYRYHASRHAWEADRRRERAAYARGDDFRRYTWGDVFERPEPVLVELQMLLPQSP